MKKIIFITLLFASFAACKKGVVTSTSLASINIVNAVVSGPSLLFNGYPATINNNNNMQFSVATNDFKSLYVYPLADSINPYVNREVDLNGGDVYTVFLSGTTTAVDTQLIKEKFTPISDSATGIRFINLSPNSPVVNVTLSTSSTVTEFSNLGYKQISGFKYYPALYNTGNYTFQIRNASSNAIISSFTLSMTTAPLPKFQHITLVFRGIVGGSPTSGITRVNHYVL